jgi:hypothetical protein
VRRLNSLDDEGADAGELLVVAFAAYADDGVRAGLERGGDVGERSERDDGDWSLAPLDGLEQ